MEGISSNLSQMFTPTGQWAEPILPLDQLCQGHWWGYESHSVIFLVLFYFSVMHVFNRMMSDFILRISSYFNISTRRLLNLQRGTCEFHVLCLCNVVVLFVEGNSSV